MKFGIVAWEQENYKGEARGSLLPHYVSGETVRKVNKKKITIKRNDLFYF